MKKLFILFSLVVLCTIQLQAIVVTMYYYQYEGKMYFGTGPKPGEGAVPIKDAHIPTFEVLKSAYAKDKRNLYYCGIKIQKKPSKSVNIDASGYVIVDNKTVYYRGKHLLGADVPSFHIYSTQSGTPIAKDKKQVYKGEEQSSIEAASLKQINDVYFSDRNGIYCAYSRNFGEMLKDAALGDVSYNPDFTDYLISNGNVYYRGYKTPFKADGFKIFDHYYQGSHGRTVEDVHLFRSGDSIYIGEQSLDLDVESFQLLGEKLVKDKNGVYSISFSNRGYRDVYFLDRLPLHSSDTRSTKLRILYAHNYSNDYYLLGDNSNTFIGKYSSHKMPDIDWDTFEPYLAVENKTFYKDKNTVYMLKIIHGLSSRPVLTDLNVSGKNITTVSFTFKDNKEYNEPLLCLKDDSVAILFKYRELEKLGRDIPSFRLVYADNEGDKYRTVSTRDSTYQIPVPDKLAKYADKRYLYDLGGYRIRELREGEYNKLVKQSPTPESWEQKRIETLEKLDFK